MREMKDSGIAWIGEIPKTWKIIANKYIFNNYKTIVSNPNNFQLLSLTTKGVKEKDNDNVGGKVPENYNDYQVVERNDLIMCLFDLDCSAVFSGLSQYNGMISPAYKILKPKNKSFCVSFYEYWFRFVSSERFYKQYSKSLRYTLNIDEFGWLKSAVPPLDEQKRIADILDKKCGEVDGIIQDIQTQIKTLDEYKRSIITESVTRGLNPNVEMKDSGVKYIGTIPRNWVVDKVKFHLKRDEVKNRGGMQVLSLYREYGVIPKDSRDDNHNVTSEDTSKYKYVRKGNFVINKMKAWQGSVAVSNYEGIVSPAYYVYSFIDNVFKKRYFHYLLRSCYKEEFRRLSGGIREGQWDLDSVDFENTLILIPPLDEQQQIADYLDKKCGEIDSVVTDKKKQIETLEEYKKSLIYEYVTGKKEIL